MPEPSIKEVLNEIGEKSHDEENVVEVGGEKAYTQELDNITDHRTLGEVVRDEEEQWNQTHKILHDHELASKREASFLIDKLINHVMRNLGVMGAPGFLFDRFFTDTVLARKDAANKLYQENRIRLSRHLTSQVDENWKAGLYIYLDKELAYFISHPEKMKYERVLGPEFWLVRTNVILPGAKGTIH